MTSPGVNYCNHSRLRPHPRRVAFALTAAGLVCAFLFLHRQPVHRGKPADAWLDELGEGSYGAVQAFREMGPNAVAPLIRGLGRQPVAGLQILTALCRHAPRFLKPGLDCLCSSMALRDSRIPRVRAAAAQMLGDLGPPAAKAAPALVNALADPNPILRRNAAFALGKIRARPEWAVPALGVLLRDSNEEVRMYAAIALKKFGAQAASAVPALIAGLKDGSWQVRERAALALGTAGRDQPAAVAALEQAISDEHRFVRSSAATALASLAPQASAARAALEQARYDPDAGVRYSAGLAMSQIDTEAGVTADGKE